MNASLLAVVNILLRYVSVSFNAFVSRKIGAEAMGLLTLVMSVYGLSVTVASSGVHLAAVQLTARTLSQPEEERPAALRALVWGCVLYSLLFGLSAALLLFTASDGIGKYLLADVRTVPSLRALALSLPAISLSSALSGYFTGIRRVYKNVIVSVLEQFIKITLTASVLLLFAPAGVEFACLAVVGGAAAAEGFSFVTALLLFLGDRGILRGTSFRHTVHSHKKTFPEVFRTAFPMAVGSYARQGLLTAEHLAIPWGLRKSGAASSAALASYGVLHGMVYPLIFFPASVLSSFSSLLVPEFAECRERGDWKRIRRMTEKVLRTSLLFSVGVSAVFIGFAHEIGEGLYPGTDAAAHLAVIAPLIPVMYLDSATDSMLKGLGEQMHTMKINIIDSLSCLLLVVLLLPPLGLRGYFLVQYICELMNAALSISRLLSVTGLRPRILLWIGLPLGAVLLSSSAVRFLSSFPGVPIIGGDGSTAARIAATAFLYLILILPALKTNIGENRKSIP